MNSSLTQTASSSTHPPSDAYSAASSHLTGRELTSWAVLVAQAKHTEQLVNLFIVMVSSCYRTVEDGEGACWLAAGRALQTVLQNERFGAVIERAEYDLETISIERELRDWGEQRLQMLSTASAEVAALEALELGTTLNSLQCLDERSPRWLDALRTVRAWRDDPANQLALAQRRQNCSL